MSEPLDSLLDSFDEVTIARGVGYVNRGAVTKMWQGERGVIAQVQGTRKAPYDVHVPFSRGASRDLDPASGACTCPVGVMCKHIVAVTLAYYGDTDEFDEDGFDDAAADQEDLPPRERSRIVPFPGSDARLGGTRSRESILEDLDRILRTPVNAADTVLPIEGSSKPWKASLAGEPVRAPPSKNTAAKDEQRWRLAFLVSDSPNTVGRSRLDTGALDDARHAFIAPASQYLRKTGEPGRVERYRAERRHEPEHSGAEELLEKLVIDGGEAPLLLHLDHLLAHPDLPIYPAWYEGRGHHDHPLRLARIERIGIAFQPKPQEEYAAHDLRFRLVLRVELERGCGAEEPLEASWVDAWRRRLVALAGDRWLGWCEGDERQLALVRRLGALRQRLDLGDLAELRARIGAEKGTLLTLDLPYRSVRLVTPRPQPDLLLQEKGEETAAELVFRYPEEKDVAPAEGSGGDAWVILRRDLAFEEQVARTLRALFTVDVGRTRIRSEPWGERPSWRFRGGMGDFLAAYGQELLSRGIGLAIGERANRLTGTGIRLQVRVSSGIDWFDLSVSAGEDLDLSRIDPRDPLFARGFVRVGERIIYIGAEEAEKLRRIMALLDPSQRSPRMSRHDLEGAAVLQELATGTPPMELERAAEIHRALTAPGAFAEAPVPHGFRGTLRDYQRVGFGWLSFLAESGLNGCLADDMGLGKTVQALALVLGLKEKAAASPAGTSLVVAPVSTLRNWEAEAARFAPSLRTVVHHGIERQRDAGSFDAADLVVVSYATLRVDQELFAAREWMAVILDEAQSIKNPGSQSFAAVKALKSRHRFTLTGTPLENSVIDLWAQFDFLEPGLLGSLQRFRKRFGARDSDAPDPERQRLRRVVRPFILRRTKEVVEKSLPPREEIRLYAEMGPRQKEAYDALKEGYRARIVEAIRAKGVAGCGALVFEGLLRLRQAACIPEHAHPSLKGLPSAKLELLEDVLGEIVAEGHRVLVFSQFVQSLKVIAGLLDERTLPYVYLDGSTRKRQEVVDRFQSDTRIPLFLLSLKAGGLGINLTAADYVVIFDPWWNPAVERQAVDRSHRIGQRKPVFVYRLITRDSIEERILSLQDRKRALAADLIEENPRSLLSLGEEAVVGFFS